MCFCCKSFSINSTIHSCFGSLRSLSRRTSYAIRSRAEACRHIASRNCPIYTTIYFGRARRYSSGRDFGSRESRAIDSADRFDRRSSTLLIPIPTLFFFLFVFSQQSGAICSNQNFKPRGVRYADRVRI